MHSFRWPDLAHDVALATEVASVRPHKPADWDLIITKLSAAFSTAQRPVHLKVGDVETKRNFFESIRKKILEHWKGETYVLFVSVSVFPCGSCVSMYVFACVCVYMCLCAHLCIVTSRSGTEEDYTALQQLLGRYPSLHERLHCYKRCSERIE